MSEIKIEKFKTELGDDYELVKMVWDEICKRGFLIECKTKLEKNKVPVGECTDLQKVLLACIAFLENEETKMLINEFLESITNPKIILVKKFIVNVCNVYQLPQGTIIKVRHPFFIIIE